MEASTDAVHGGVGSLRLAVRGHGSVTAESAPVALEVGRLYRLSAWIRTQGAVSDATTKYPTAVPACLTMASFPFTNHSAGGRRRLGLDPGRESVFRHPAGRPGASPPGSQRQRPRHVRGSTMSVSKGWTTSPSTSRWRPSVGRARASATTTAVGSWSTSRASPTSVAASTGRWFPTRSFLTSASSVYLANEADPEAGWRRLRFECDTIFLRTYDEEYPARDEGHRRRRGGRRRRGVGPAARSGRHRHHQLGGRSRPARRRHRGHPARAHRRGLLRSRRGARHRAGEAQLLGLRGHGTGDRDRRHRLRPDLHVGRIHRGPLECHHRCGADPRQPARLPHLPRGHSLRRRLLSQ